jgi:hypothetical protein
VALETLARRRRRDLAAEGVTVVAMGGATNIGRFLETYGPAGQDLRVLGLCDAQEARFFGRALERSGLAIPGAATDLAAYGFFVCVEDLEDELVRALGVAAVEAVVSTEGELAALRTLQRQPAQRERPAEAQLRRFLGSHSGRKARYARALVQALEPSAVPVPLDRLLERI